MKRPFSILAAAAFAVVLSIPLYAAEWKNVALMDGHCIEKAKDAPDDHPRSCAIQCAKGGYGVITADGKYLRFDEAGNAKALEALKKSDKKDHLRANVEGTLKDGVIQVTSFSLE